ncbi:LysM peptidoglycan-binding domain-containing protein [Listeria monocytogenes]|uniref:LysM peptidoglycan-binding domain-containing protein n=1 Tax=Listeria monocytogenes TaxID=1639 RepID=UPI000BE0139E|nr:LysM peptidoglycan-binding domain-containing protein [Listeria monocytogenes]EAF1501433.1 LysM peptidoglycan-binding domain-containing protein [Listeria monocytogenes]EAH0378539.1 LysM peptidoglycan-binding domain-containing protein [Listeria monocytogenes]EAH0911816.1 LysM peptidoglycan-binding domain-containing protein [Listeria monocytogenes]EAH2863137.1 LysM peptidoglycan-binding domain-containing protein [Listeria monocytogenes]EKZ4098672.1 LysM peptidoglycan-binding domain-containing 
MVKTRKEKREYEEPADYDMSSEGQDEFNNEPPMLSRSDSRRGKKKTIFRYPLLNLLIVFFLLIPIVIVIVFVTVQNMGSSNEVKTETESTVNVSDNTQSKEEKEKAKKAAEEKAAADKAAAEKAAAEKAEQQKANEASQQKAGGSHTVKAGDTLYSIARSTYGQAGAAAGVEKIKQANGLGSDNVPVGTVLTIPQ